MGLKEYKIKDENLKASTSLRMVNSSLSEVRTMDKAIFNNVFSDLFLKSFMLSLSHEVRTPLNAILGFSDLICNEGLTQEDKNKYSKQIKENSTDLLETIDNLFDLSLINANKFKCFYEYHYVHELVEDLFEKLKQFNNKKDVASLIKIPFELKNVMVFTDKKIVEKVLGIFISNAVKFTRFGRIQLSVQKCHDSLLFEVMDTGCGITDEKLRFIFEPFQKYSDKDLPDRGLGVGLTLALKLTRLIQGKIKVKSTSKKGSSFCFEIPL